jgi:hypothetical protein
MVLMFTEIEIKQSNLQESEKSLVSDDVENMARFKEHIIIHSCECWSKRGEKNHHPYRTWDTVSRHVLSTE